jgi:transport and Golgi organization protein 2
MLGPGTLVLGANRDESPDRPTAGPGVLVSDPRVVGGRDLVSGGTWLAVRDSMLAVAVLNRRTLPADTRDPATFRSRGLLCLDVASYPRPNTIDSSTGKPYEPWFLRFPRMLRAGTYAPCTLIWATPGLALVIEVDGVTEPRLWCLSRSWHVVTHQDIDDREEPRTKWLLEQLKDERPDEIDDAVEKIKTLLRSHGETGGPHVCLHRDRFPTVSSTILVFAKGKRPRYLHAPGPPCVTPYEDHSNLLEPISGGSPQQ